MVMLLSEVLVILRGMCFVAVLVIFLCDTVRDVHFSVVGNIVCEGGGGLC